MINMAGNGCSFTIKHKKMAEVFKTNVKQVHHAKKMLMRCFNIFQKSKINIDLKNCDKILRIDGHNIFSTYLIDVLKSKGFICGT